MARFLRQPRRRPPVGAGLSGVLSRHAGLLPPGGHVRRAGPAAGAGAGDRDAAPALPRHPAHPQPGFRHPAAGAGHGRDGGRRIALPALECQDPALRGSARTGPAMAHGPAAHRPAARRPARAGDRLRLAARPGAHARHRPEDPAGRLHPLGHRRAAGDHRHGQHRAGAAARAGALQRRRIARAQLRQRPPLPADAAQPHGLRDGLRGRARQPARPGGARPLCRRGELVLRLRACGEARRPEPMAAGAHPRRHAAGGGGPSRAAWGWRSTGPSPRAHCARCSSPP